MQSQLRQGQIYDLPDCPPLEGGVAKPRPVVVVSPKPILDDPKQLVLVLGITSSQIQAGRTDIPLPHKQQSPAVKTGLDRPSWAIARWLMVIDRAKLTRLRGYVSSKTLDRILLAVDEIRDDQCRQR